jgi:hypothetical protein
VLLDELFVGYGSALIGSGVSPAIDEVSALAVSATAVTDSTFTVRLPAAGV